MVGIIPALALIKSGLGNLVDPAASLRQGLGGAPPDPAGLNAMAGVMTPAFLGSYGLLIFVASVFYMVFYGAMTKSIASAARGESLTVGAAMMNGWRRLPRLFLGSFLTGLGLVGGFILLIVPGIFLLGKWQLWQIVLYAEDASATDSITASWRLTDQRWWRGVAIISVALVLTMVASTATGVIGLVGSLIGKVPLVTILVSGVLRSLVYMTTTPLTICMGVAMYHDFKLRREGADLAARLGNLAA
jgi:hypothetical protein